MRLFSNSFSLLPLVLTFLLTFLSLEVHADLPVEEELPPSPNGYRPHTDWEIIDFGMNPIRPKAGDSVEFYISIGITTLIDPLPQTVNIAFYLDGYPYASGSLTFKSPTDILTVWARWLATEGNHYIELVVDPNNAYADPNTYNNNAHYRFAVEKPPPETYDITIYISGIPSIYHTNIEVDDEPAGTVVGEDSKKYAFIEGTLHKITAKQYIDGEEGTRYYCASNEWTVSTSGEYTFRYETEFFLEIYVQPSVTENPSSGWYSTNEVVEIICPAIIEESLGVQYKFSEWVYDSKSHENPKLSINMDNSYRVAVKYDAYYFLAIHSEFGEVEGVGWYKSGEVATFSVSQEIPSEGILGLLGGKTKFVDWSGDFTGEANVASLEMNSPKSVVAEWTPENTMPYAIIALGVFGTVAGIVGYHYLGKKDPCADLRRELIDAKKELLKKEKESDEAEERVKEAEGKLKSARDELVDSERARKDAKEARRRAEKKPEEDSWIESKVEGRLVRITSHDLRLKSKASKEAWGAYKRGKISGQECMRRWDELGEPGATEKLRHLDEENRKRVIEELKKNLEKSEKRKEEAKSRLDEAKNDYEKAKKDVHVKKEELESARKNAEELRKQLAGCEEEKKRARPPRPTMPPTAPPKVAKPRATLILPTPPSKPEIEEPIEPMPEPNESESCSPEGAEAGCKIEGVKITPFEPDMEEIAEDIGRGLDIINFFGSIPTSLFELGKKAGEVSAGGVPSPSTILKAGVRVHKKWLARLGVYVYLKCSYLRCEKKEWVRRQDNWVRLAPSRGILEGGNPNTWNFPGAVENRKPRQSEMEQFLKNVSEEVADYCRKRCSRRSKS